MKGVIIFSFLLTIFFYASCSPDQNGNANEDENDDVRTEEEIAKIPEKLSPRNYVAWVEDKNNGLKVEKTIGEFTYSLLYKPLDYVALMDLKKDSIGSLELNKKKEEYEGLQYFTFRISTESRMELLKKNLRDANEYHSRVHYFSFEMQKDLKLIDGKDTLDCMLFHFERVYGVAPYATFVLGFPKTETDEKANKELNTKMYNDKTVVFLDNVFGAGYVYLKIKAKNLNRIPKLSLEQ